MLPGVRLPHVFLISIALSAAGLASDADDLFVRRVLPLFQEKCLACHGKDEAKIKSGFDMRTAAGLLKGGESGEAAIVAGHPEKSSLYLASTRQHDDWEPMPPKENDRLSAEQLGWIKDWISGGAPWPDEAARQAIAHSNADKWSAEDGIPVKTSGGLAAEWTNRRYKPENLWAYQPLKKPAVPKIEGTANPIDAFIAARLPAGMEVAPLADRRMLIRRATFDLLGLPPTPEEIAAFVNDPASEEDAFAKVVERLLASPHYGEQWGRHWLDVVRYADSSGFANDYERGTAWRYRDYVVRAFNNDKPYDRFIVEQIAGDELDASNPENLIATGFLRMGAWELTSMEVPKVARQRYLDDVTQSVGETFLAQALQCARCHDHKFDPVPTRDYYSIQACFTTTQLVDRRAPYVKGENVSGFEERKYLDEQRTAHLVVLKELDEKSLAAADQWFGEKGLDRTAWDAAVANARQREAGDGKRDFLGGFEGARKGLLAQQVPEGQFPPKALGFKPEDFGRERVARKGLERLRWAYERYTQNALAVYSGRTPELKTVAAPIRMPETPLTTGELEESAILTGGDPFSPGLKVTPALLSVAAGDQAPAVPTEITGRRLALARWIATPENPLTARAIVNRLWLWHFGRAIVGNPNNFGATGKKPTHPELLDWLASEFVERGWSMKALHRVIMSSAAYRRVARAGAGEAEYAAFTPRRLSAEELRDTMLTASGELNPQIGGIPSRPEINLEAAMQPRQVMGTFAEAWVPNPLPAQRNRRSFYALHLRGLRDPFMEVFNEPSPELSCEGRDASTVTPQVFGLFNSRTSYARALAFASRLQRETTTREAAIDRAFQLAFGRAATPAEISACVAHWDAMTARHRELHFDPPKSPLNVTRDAVEENTGENFAFREQLGAYADFVPDLQPSDASAETRGLAEVCLVLLNTNEFAYVY